MRIVAIMLALVLVLRNGPSTSMTPTAPTPAKSEDIWHMALPEAIRIGLVESKDVNCIWIGAQKIPLGGFEPTVAPSSANVTPNVAKPTGGDSGPDEE